METRVTSAFARKYAKRTALRILDFGLMKERQTLIRDRPIVHPFHQTGNAVYPPASRHGVFNTQRLSEPEANSQCLTQTIVTHADDRIFACLAIPGETAAASCG
jgi:hypothetical protein